MRICSWNINGLRSLKQSLKNVLELLDCDIVCFQETKVTRQALAEEYARIDGYHTFYSWSRVRQGYSGVAIFCKTPLAPIKAEEGLAGKLNLNVDDTLGGEYPSMDDSELSAIDREGRAIATEHKLEDGNSLVIINVYCPRVDPDKPERLMYKLNFFAAIEQRCQYFVECGYHVIVVGDFNVSHRPIDTCKPGDDLNYFNMSPSRLWFSKFVAEENFIDTFRCLHPNQREAYTCWETLTGARANNYGVRIDYVLCDAVRTKAHLIDCRHRVEIESSDHCPVIAEFNFQFMDRSQEKPASICTRFWSEFKGTQMKLNQFLLKTKRPLECENEQTNTNESEDNSSDIEILSIKSTTYSQNISSPREAHGKPNAVSKGPLKKAKSDQTSLFQHFTRSSQSKSVKTENPISIASASSSETSNKDIDVKPKSSASWSQIFRPPTPPPLCSGHKEKCVIRQVKDAASTNWGRYFYVCARANGSSDNPQARCDYFQWKDTKKKNGSTK